MRKKMHWLLVVGCLALGVVTPALAYGQANTTGDSTSKAHCERDRAALAARDNVKAYSLALRSIQSCGAMAGETLAHEWPHPPVDTSAVRLLGAVSANVPDQRIFSAARLVATSPGRPTAERLAAMAALVAYAEPTVRLIFLDPEHPSELGNAYVMLGHPTDLPPAPPGSVPLAASVRPDVLDLLGQLGSSDPDARVRKIAAYVARRLAAGQS